MTRSHARTEQLRPDTARWLISEPGRATTANAHRALTGGEEELRVVSALRDDGLDVARAAAAMSAAHARSRMPSRDGPGDRLVFTRSALEQASDPQVAAWRARRFAGMHVVDAGCGAGSDLLELALTAERVVGVDHDEARVVLAGWNLQAYDRDAHVVVGDALHLPVRVGVLHADPSRRRDGRRARTLDAYRPPVSRLLTAARTGDAGVVVSPAVDWADPSLPRDAEVEFVQRGSDLVEAVVWLGALRRSGARATATIVAPDREPVTRSHDGGPDHELRVGAIGEVLLEVAPAAVRARLHDRLGAEIGAHRIARTRALLTAAHIPPPSPWWRAWQVEAVLPARPKDVRRWLRQAEQQPLSIATAGYDADPATWWRQLGRPRRGPQGRRLLLTRLDEGSRALLLRGPIATTDPADRS